MSEFENNDIITYNSVASNNNALVPASPDNVPAQQIQEPQQSDFLPKMISKWPVVLVIFITLATMVVPAVWLFTPKSYQSQILIEVLSITPIVFSDPDDSAKTSDYTRFKNSQATLMLAEGILQRTADLLRDKELHIFTPSAPNLKEKVKQVWKYKDLSFLKNKEKSRYKILRNMVKDGNITALADQRTDYIFLSVKANNLNDARLIAEAIRQSYKEVELSKMDEVSDKKIIALEEELKQITRDVERQDENILKLSFNYGYADLSKRHAMIINRMEGIQEQLTLALSEKSKLESSVKKLELALDSPVDLPETSEKSTMEQQSQYVKNDERLNTLTQTLIQEEQKLIMLEQNLTEDNPEISRQKDVINTLNEKVESRRQELKDEFTSLIESEKDLLKKDAVEARQAELEQTKAVFEEQMKYIDLLETQYESDNNEAIEIGQLDTLIKRKEAEKAQKESIRQGLQDKIQKLRIESKRPARINANMPVSTIELKSKKIKLLGGAVFGCLALGLGVAFLQVKMDKSILFPEDIIRQAGLSIIGTTINPSSVKKDEVSQYITMDYQNIRANLKLLNNGDIPQVLGIVSAEPEEGKTTLSINLASSLARSNHKVLLIDGDLRKPDIHKIISLPERTVGLREVASGVCLFEDAVFEDYHPNLDVLRACGSTNFDSIQLLSGQGLFNFIDRIKGQYDHIIIDTTPILAAPDALLWARLTDAVILSSLSGKTTSSSLKVAVERLSKLNIRILGNILASVKDRPGYGYGHNYYDYKYGKTTKKKRKNRKNNHLLFSVEPNNIS